MKFTSLIAVTTCVMATPGIAAAQERFDYRYLEMGFVHAEIDDTSIDGNGFRVEGLHEFGGSFFASAEYETYDFENNIDASTFLIGGGYIHPLASEFDFIAKGQFAQVEVENYDDDGIGIGGGIRTRLADTFEVDAMLNWFDFDNGGSDTYIDLKGRYYVNDRFAVSVNLDIGSDYFETMGVGVRFDL